jgi:hypothetical protein
MIPPNHELSLRHHIPVGRFKGSIKPKTAAGTSDSGFCGKDDERRVLRHGANSAAKRRAGFLVTLAAQHPEPSLGLDAERPGKELTT